MKFLVTGAKGQLGYDVVEILRGIEGNEVCAVDKDTFDILDLSVVIREVSVFNPDIIIHCAAFTAVDLAEDMSDICFRVNVEGTKNIVEAAILINAQIVYISTDYVFDGEKMGIYETDDLPSPINVYGLSKYYGELEVLKYSRSYVLRTSWVFGKNGVNFVSKILKATKENKTLYVVDDQLGCPTYTIDLAHTIVDLCRTNKFGIYHAANDGWCTWYDFATEILRLISNSTKIIPVQSDHYLSKARRPHNSRLSTEKLVWNGLNKLPSWKDALSRYLKETGDIL